MDNTEINFDNIQNKVTFYIEDKKYYFIYNNEKHICNYITLNKLKEQLILPYKISFIGISRIEYEKILSLLIDNNISINTRIIRNREEKLYKYEVVFYLSKNKIDAYKIPNISSLYGRYNECSPYMLVTSNNKNILIEVTKDYVKTTPGEYYFLASDLSKNEQTFFDSLYVELEYDYLYKLEQKTNTKEKSKVLTI